MNTVEQWVAGAQIQGDRNYQEDSFSITLLTGNHTGSDRLLLVLADGMGGHAGGAVASDTVVQTFWEGFSRTAGGVPTQQHTATSPDGTESSGQSATDVAVNLRAGIDTANQAVKAKQQADAALSEMGSTLIAALVLGHKLYWASVGDSILWLFRDGRLHRLNEDHSMRPLLFDLVELGRLTEEEALSDPKMHHLRSAIFGEDVSLIDISADGYPLEAGDMVLLASDGLETLSEKALTVGIKAHENDAQQVVSALLDRVSTAEAPNQDNTTVLAYRVGHEEHSLHSTLAEMEASTQLSDVDGRDQNIRIQKDVFDPAKETMETPGVFTRMKVSMFNRNC